MKHPMSTAGNTLMIVGAAAAAAVALIALAERWGERGLGDLRAFARGHGMTVVVDGRVAEFSASGTWEGLPVALEMLRPRTGRRTVTESTRLRVARAAPGETALIRARRDGAFEVALDPTRVQGGYPVATGDAAFDASFLVHAATSAAPRWLDASTRVALQTASRVREVQVLGTEVTVVLGGHVTEPAALEQALSLATRLAR